MTYRIGNLLVHDGVKGMHWGSNRWWTPDHKLTPEGRIHYGYGDANKEPKKSWNARKYLNEDGSPTEEAKARSNEFQVKRGTMAKDLGIDLFGGDDPREIFELDTAIDQAYHDKIGGKRLNEILYGKDGKSGWYKMLSKVYTADYSDFKTDSDTKKAWEKAKKEFEQLRDENEKMWETAFSDFRNDPKNKTFLKKMSNFFDETYDKATGLTVNDRRKVHRKLTSSDKFQENARKLAETDSLIYNIEQKLGDEYKEVTLNNIMKEVPVNLQDDVYDYLHEFAWYWD